MAQYKNRHIFVHSERQPLKQKPKGSISAKKFLNRTWACRLSSRFLFCRVRRTSAPCRCYRGALPSHPLPWPRPPKNYARDAPVPLHPHLLPLCLAHSFAACRHCRSELELRVPPPHCLSSRALLLAAAPYPPLPPPSGSFCPTAPSRQNRSLFSVASQAASPSTPPSPVSGESVID